VRAGFYVGRSVVRPRLPRWHCAAAVSRDPAGGRCLPRSSTVQNNLTVPRHHRPDRTLGRRRLPAMAVGSRLEYLPSLFPSSSGWRPAGGIGSGTNIASWQPRPRPARRLYRRRDRLSQRSAIGGGPFGSAIFPAPGLSLSADQEDCPRYSLFARGRPFYGSSVLDWRPISASRAPADGLALCAGLLRLAIGGHRSRVDPGDGPASSLHVRRARGGLSSMA